MDGEVWRKKSAAHSHRCILNINVGFNNTFTRNTGVENVYRQTTAWWGGGRVKSDELCLQIECLLGADHVLLVFVC